MVDMHMFIGAMVGLIINAMIIGLCIWGYRDMRKRP